MDTYDVVVIGSGPGGYVCAIRAAQLGLGVACIEKDPTFGGTCLNVGCIPSKALLESSELYHRAHSEFSRHGIVVSPTLDLPTMLARKDKIVGQLTKGVAGLFKKNGISTYTGTGRFKTAQEIEVVAADGSVSTIGARNVVVATGSTVAKLKNVEADGEHIVGSTEALSFPEVPKHLLVIGAGVIGLELGSVWRRLGAEVTVLEYMPVVFPGSDADISKQAQRSFRRLGIKFKLGVAVQKAEVGDDGVTLTYSEKGTEKTITGDKCLVAVGRWANTAGLQAEAIGLKVDERGRVEIDEHFATNVPGVFAIGDVVRGPMLAHKAEDEGVALAERLAGKPGHVNYDAIPGVIYTHPEVASVGKTQQQLEEAGIAFTVGTFPFAPNGRAKAQEATEGFVKLLADAATDRLLGAHIIGPQAGELIAELTLALEFGASAEDVARTCHAHPTLSEAVKEAALDAGGRVIHF